MTPFIAKLIERGCITADPNSQIQTVINLLVKWQIGTVVIVDAKGIVLGILSEREIIKYIAKEQSLLETTAEELMTTEVVTVEEDINSSELMHLMTVNKIRHVPIIKNNKLVGIVSMGDVVKRMLEKYERETELIREFINS